MLLRIQALASINWQRKLMQRISPLFKLQINTIQYLLKSSANLSSALHQNKIVKQFLLGLKFPVLNSNIIVCMRTDVRDNSRGIKGEMNMNYLIEDMYTLDHQLSS